MSGCRTFENGCGYDTLFDMAHVQGSWTMLRAMLLDRKCWQSAVMLDPITGFVFANLSDFRIGLDPPGFKLRAASGFEAADFFVAGIKLTGFVVQLTPRLLDMEQGTNLPARQGEFLTLSLDYREPCCNR
jgi:hypothetical protein